MDESKPYDVVLIPSDAIAAKSVALSETLAARGSYFTLDNANYFPHISLYMLQLDSSGLDKTREVLPQIAEETQKVEGVVTDYKYINNYLEVDYAISPEFAFLQEQVVAKLNPLRSGLRDKEKARLTTSTGRERENILQYGYRWIGDLFNPHISFARFKDNQESCLVDLPPKETFAGKFSAIGIYEMGDHGTCAKEVGRYMLQS
ncbi:MAG TPA: hypothetical protein VI953_00295 [Candidatus Paceibacterota bacterium]